MKLESVGILIGMRPFGERDCIARIFTRDYGVLSGMLKGASSAKKNKPLIGQYGNVSWNARLDSQLGTFHFESQKNMTAQLMMSPKLLMYVNSAFSLIVGLLPERAEYENLFIRTQKFLIDLSENKNDADYSNFIYLDWEINLIRELGYAFDIGKCSGCSCTQNLNYLSPKTGRAVCDDCAVPYIDKLFKLPLSTSITKRFLINVCESQGISMPVNRNMIS